MFFGAEVDLCRCQRCHRPSRFWGDRDKETGWVGWCLVCNWVWRFGDVTRLMAFRLLKPLPRDAQGKKACGFLAGQACYAQVLSGSARSALRRVEQAAIRRVWYRILLGSRAPCVRELDGTIRECDSDDEDENGVCDANLDYVNPFWKLELARGTPDYDERPLAIVIKMLGKCPMGHDTWRPIRRCNPSGCA